MALAGQLARAGLSMDQMQALGHELSPTAPKRPARHDGRHHRGCAGLGQFA